MGHISQRCESRNHIGVSSCKPFGSHISQRCESRNFVLPFSVANAICHISQRCESRNVQHYNACKEAGVTSRRDVRVEMTCYNSSCDIIRVTSRRDVRVEIPSKISGYWWPAGHISQRCESRNLFFFIPANKTFVTSRRDVRVEILDGIKPFPSPVKRHISQRCESRNVEGSELTLAKASHLAEMWE